MKKMILNKTFIPIFIIALLLVQSCDKNISKDPLKNTEWELSYFWTFSNGGTTNLEFKRKNIVISGDYKGTYTIIDDQVSWTLESDMDSKFEGIIQTDKMSGSMTNNFGNYGSWSAIKNE